VNVNTLCCVTPRIVGLMGDAPADRLKEARVNAKFATAEAACQAFGWKPAAYRHHEGGIRSFDVETAVRYARAFKVSAAWLLGLEDGPAAKAAPVKPAPPASNDDTVEIVQLDLSLSMGPGTLIDDYVEGRPVRFDLVFIQSITRTTSDRLRLVRGIGDSMYPTLNGGDAIMIDTTQRALSRQDGIYWVSIYGAAGIKRLRSVGPKRILVVSDNPAVENYEVDANDVRIEGRAIWFARDL
jgi:phage repressor protein C with HTH and peptisase S24 domain